MKWFLAAMLMLTLLTLMIGNHSVVATSSVETAFTGCCDAVTDHTLANPVGIYLTADNGDANNNGNGEEKEKELEADPAGGVDRIWNSVQLA
jgi:hypothetical protein